MTRSFSQQTDQFEIRQFHANDELALIKAWKEAYPDLFRFKYPERWLWNMFGNPFVPECKRPLCWIALRGNEIAAWTCAMAVPLNVAGHMVIGGHSVDTFTLEKYRRYGLGKTLQKLNQEAHTIFSSIDLSPVNRRNKYKIGGYPGKALDTWLRIGTRLDRDMLYDSFLRLVAKYLGSAGKRFFSECRDIGLARLLNFACSTALRIRQNTGHVKVVPASTDLTFESIKEFGKTSDLLWRQVSKTYSFAISRNSDYLNWKYVHQPNLDYRKTMVLRGGVPVGLLVYRLPFNEEQRVGIISECFCVDDEWQLHADIVAYAIEDFKRHDIDVIKLSRVMVIDHLDPGQGQPN